MSEKCRNNKHNNNNSDNPLTSRRTDGGKNNSKHSKNEYLQKKNFLPVHRSVITVLPCGAQETDHF